MMSKAPNMVDIIWYPQAASGSMGCGSSQSSPTDSIAASVAIHSLKRDNNKIHPFKRYKKRIPPIKRDNTMNNFSLHSDIQWSSSHALWHVQVVFKSFHSQSLNLSLLSIKFTLMTRKKLCCECSNYFCSSCLPREQGCRTRTCSRWHQLFVKNHNFYIFSILYNQVSGAAQKSTSKGRLDEAEGEGLAALPLQEADQHQGVRR